MAPLQYIKQDKLPLDCKWIYQGNKEYDLSVIFRSTVQTQTIYTFK